MSAHVKVSTQGGCGCGGGGGSRSDSCSCSGHAACLEPVAYVRPRFFPGQLLTEDDLELMIDYTAAKDRLHNRFLFGDGVVCGLKVTCDPCGGGRVKVTSGYALDCCGNDIVVPCSVDLDINRMVRDLLRARGKECGDPCPEPPPEHAAPGSPSMITSAAGTSPPAASTSEKGLRYCLYVRYCERPTEPVAPYTTDDPCAAQTCQFSRVQEGYRFELRCPGEEPGHRDMLDSLDACLGPFHRTSSIGTLLRIIRTRAMVLSSALKRAPEPGGATFDPKDAEQLAQLAKKQGTDLLDEMSLIEGLAALVVRLELQDVPAGGATRSATVLAATAGGRWKNIDELRRYVIERADALLGRAEFRDLEPGGMERMVIADVLEVVKEAMDPAGRPADWDRRFATRLLAGGFALNPASHERMRGSLMVSRDRLIGAIGARISDCRLPAELAELTPGPRASEVLTEEEVLGLQKGMETVVRGADRVTLDCFCGSVLPECAPCEDPAVLLACLRVEDCRVIEVCNLVRRFVLAPATARYWGGAFLERFGDQLEQLCCGGHDEIRPVTTTTGRWPQFERVATVIRAASDRVEFSTAFADAMGIPDLVTRAMSPRPAGAAAGLSAASRRSRRAAKKKGGP